MLKDNTLQPSQDFPQFLGVPAFLFSPTIGMNKDEPAASSEREKGISIKKSPAERPPNPTAAFPSAAGGFYITS